MTENETDRNFVAKALAGEFDDPQAALDDFVARWHASLAAVPLPEWLGFTQAEWDTLLTQPNKLSEILAARTAESEKLVGLSRAIADVMLPCIDTSDGAVEIDWIPIARWVYERDREYSETLELLANALDLSKPLVDLHARKGTLKFLAEELIDSRRRILAAYVNDHGGAPAQGPNPQHWHLTRQFMCDVWNVFSPEHRLYLDVVCLNPAAVAAFVAELEQWILFIESSGPGDDGDRWTYEDPSSRERFAIQQDKLNDCDALLHAFEDHDLEQIGTSSADGICIWEEYKEFTVPWPVIEHARRRQKARER